MSHSFIHSHALLSSLFFTIVFFFKQDVGHYASKSQKTEQYSETHTFEIDDIGGAEMAVEVWDDRTHENNTHKSQETLIPDEYHPLTIFVCSSSLLLFLL